MSASAIMQGLINNLSATSALGACSIGLDYSVNETQPEWSGVLTFRRVVDEIGRSTFGNVHREVVWTFSLEGYIKDTGDAGQVLTRSVQFTDKLVTSLQSDPDIQGTAEGLQTIRGTKNPGEVFSPPQGAVSSIPLFFEIDVLEFVET